MRYWIELIAKPPGPLKGELARFAVALGVVAAALLAAALWAAPLPDRLNDRHSTVVYYANEMPAHVFLSEDDRWRVASTLDDVDPAYVDALLRFEDKRFYDHFGVDPIAVARAAWLNLAFGRRMSGASTITMQLVRVLEPRPRTYLSKAIEAVRAMQIEMRLSKEEILAAYLTFAPYGRNLEGVEAASLAYFGHSASELSPAEIATLLAVPQNPNIRYPTAENQSRLREARDEIAAWLLEEEMLPLGPPEARVSGEEALAMVEATAVPEELRAFPREMPHVAYWLREKHPDDGRIYTTIDAGVQLVAERVVANHRDRAWQDGIDAASVVVVDHATGEVKALVGNFDFFAERPGSQIPAFDVARSPGSLLKPLIFALAIERGLTHPSHLVLDVPQTFGQYSPNNYDGRFRGLVRLDEALSRSLNVPFVRLLNDIGVDELTGVLRLMDAQHLSTEPGHYGLSAAIGGVEVTPLEVAGFYAALAGDGRYRPARVVSEARAASLPVVSAGTAWLTRKALRMRDRPGYNRRKVNPDAPQIWWKTGTSYGHRDAWAAGGGSRYTAVAWLGNLDHRGSAALVGADRAGPVLFDVLEAIDFDDDGRRDPRPSDLTQVHVCSYSGHVATDACDHTETAWAPERDVPVEKCPYHVRIDVDTKTGEALVPACRAGREWESKSYVVWPATVRRFMSDRQRVGPEVPALAEGCGTHAASKPPRIVSPPHGQTIVLRRHVDADQQEIPLEAETDFATAELSWFVNGVFLGSASADDRIWWTPSPGKHELVVMDAAGHATRRLVRVR